MLTQLSSNLSKTAAARLTTLAVPVGLYLAYKLYRAKTEIKDRLNTLIIHWFSTDIQPDYRLMIRKNFSRETIRRPVNHTHPDAALARTAANNNIDHAIKQLGKIPYSISMSNRDARNGNAGTRDYYFTKDLTMQARCDSVKQKHLLKLVDVDYYVDMPHLLENGSSALIYTFVPLNVAGQTLNANYTIINNMVKTIVTGGGEYNHYIWDYSTDTLAIDYWWGTQVYLVENIIPNADIPERRVIFLNHLRTVYGPLAWLLPGKRLSRKRYQFGNYNFNKYQLEGKVNISYGTPAHYIACTLTELTFDTCAIRCSLAKEPSVSDVERILRVHDVSNPDYCAGMFINAFKSGTLPLLHDVVSTPTFDDKYNYQTLQPLVMEDGKIVARELHAPIFNSGYAPKRSYNNDNSCIEGRIDKVRNQNKRVPPFYEQCMYEFAELLIPEEKRYTFTPWTERQIEERQNRPTQRAMAEASKPFAWYDLVKIKAFQKAEIYGNINYPRNISTVNTDHKMRYSAFIYPLAEYVKQNKWYAFGKNPSEITDRILELASQYNSFLLIDYSTYDGSHGEFRHTFDRTLALRAFAPCYHSEYLRLKNSTLNKSAVTSNGVIYNTGYTQLSGSADTSFGNTTFDALLVFIAFRLQGLSPRNAFDTLGIIGGDDNLNPILSEKIILSVTHKLGYNIKVKPIHYLESVPFLGRVFLDPWNTRASICDAPRRMRGLHLTVTPNTVPKSVVLWRKAASYVITDPNTPIIKQWCALVMRSIREPLTDKYDDIIRNELPYLVDATNNYTPPDDIEYGWCMLNIACELGVSTQEVQNYCDYLDRLNHLDDIDHELAQRCDVKVAAAIGGRITK